MRITDSLNKLVPVLELKGLNSLDFIQTGDKSYVLEINPRLTSSYVGIYQALGLNVVELVLQLSEQSPRIQSARHTPVDVILL